MNKPSKLLIGLALAAAGVFGAGSAMAWGHHSRVFVGFNVGPYWGPSPWWGPYPYYYPAPVYYPPAPAYYPAPRYYQPAPVYAPAPVSSGISIRLRLPL